jgi:hypothetical protein
MDRITQKDLEELCAEINRRHGFTGKVWNQDGDRYRSTVGMFTLSGAYGGWKLERIESDGGGVSTVSHDGYGTKRQLYSFMLAYLDGMTEEARSTAGS